MVQSDSDPNHCTRGGTGVGVGVGVGMGWLKPTVPKGIGRLSLHLSQVVAL